MKRTEQVLWDGQGPPYLGDFSAETGVIDSAFVINEYQISCGMSSLTTELSVETREVRESCTGQRGVLKTIPGSRSLTVSLTLYQYSPRTLAIALFGEATDVAGGTVTDEVLPAIEAGGTLHLRHAKVSNVVIEDSTGTPIQYVEGTHYVVEDATVGRIRIIAHPATHAEPLNF